MEKDCPEIRDGYTLEDRQQKQYAIMKKWGSLKHFEMSQELDISVQMHCFLYV